MLEVLSIEDRGDYDCERVALKAVENGSVSGWKLGRSAGSPSVVTFLFSFPDVYVNNGDLIYVHTRVGTSASYYHPFGRVHVFFLNNDRPVWVDLKSTAAVGVKEQNTCIWRAKPGSFDRPKIFQGFERDLVGSAGALMRIRGDRGPSAQIIL
jgi:hypothetical protein